jgi:hypothetical protein
MEWVQRHLTSPLSSESNKASHLHFPSGSVRALLYFCGRKPWEIHRPQNVCYTWFQRRTVDSCGTRAPPRRHTSVFLAEPTFKVSIVIQKWRTAVAQWLRYCATNRKVAGSIPVIGIFHWHNPPDRTMALGSTQPLTEMSTRRISWG